MATLVVISGDLNPNSTGLKQTHLTLPTILILKQLVTFSTEESNTINWVLINE
jgi:hypothetical protein